MMFIKLKIMTKLICNKIQAASAKFMIPMSFFDGMRKSCRLASLPLIYMVNVESQTPDSTPGGTC